MAEISIIDETYSHESRLISEASKLKKTVFSIYRPEETSVVLGRGSKAEVELNLEACAADSVPLIRRKGGGCAVVLTPGSVIFAMAGPVPGIGNNNRYFSAISNYLIGVLKGLGIKGVYHDGISDLVLEDKKIAGACIHRGSGLLYYSASILAEPAIDLMERYLKHPPREPLYREGRSHRDFVGSLKGTPIKSAAELETALKEVISESDLPKLLNI